MCSIARYLAHMPRLLRPGQSNDFLKIGKRNVMSSSLLKIELSDDQTTAWVKLPGFGYDDTDRTGNIPIWKMSRLAEAGRMRLFNDIEGNPEWTRALGVDRILFMKSSHYTLHPALHTGNWLYEPITSVVRLGDIGRTSFALFQEMYPTRDPSIILNSVIITGIVGDPTTRRALPIPQTVRNVFDARHTPPPAIEFAQRPLQSQLERPRDTHVVRQVAVPSDMDEYQHMNQCHYLRYCHDAASFMTTSGTLHELRGDLANWKIKTIDAVYSGEWNAWEIVDIHVWQDTDDSMMLHFEVEKEQRIIFNLRMEFYSRDSFDPDVEESSG